MEPIILIDGKARRPLISDMLELLTPKNRMLADAYIEKLGEEYAANHVMSLTREALKYMLRLQNNGIDKALESTVKDVVGHCNAIESSSDVAKGQRKGYLRIFTGFLIAEYGLSQSIELVTGVFMYDRVVFIDDLKAQDRQRFLVSASPEGAVPTDREKFWDYACELHATLESCGYSPTTKKTLLRACQCLYVFLCANDFDYTPALAEHWINTTVISKQGDWRACRRAFALIDQYKKTDSSNLVRLIAEKERVLVISQLGVVNHWQTTFPIRSAMVKPVIV